MPILMHGLSFQDNWPEIFQVFSAGIFGNMQSFRRQKNKVGYPPGKLKWGIFSGKSKPDF
ncbi:hypothetical protein D3Z47_11710 [Lachnospiraceae bacterium]|nr:hypothetical protein [Lachnospiraceae bacterium]